MKTLLWIAVALVVGNIEGFIAGWKVAKAVFSDPENWNIEEERPE